MHQENKELENLIGYYGIKSSSGKFGIIKYIESEYQLKLFKNYTKMSHPHTCTVVAVQVTEKE